MSDKNDALPHLMAKIQALQDHFSQYFHVSISIFKSDYSPLTIPSFHVNNCNHRQNTAPNICKTFTDALYAQIMTSSAQTATCCPFGVNVLMAPLGYSHAMSSPDKPEYFLVVKQEPCDTGSGGEEYSSRASEDSFKENAAIILSCLDTVFSAMKINTDSEEEPDTASSMLPSGYENLTPREQEVARLVSIGLSNHEISERLYISEHTVKIHIGNILRKTGLKNRTQLAVYKILNI